jgi:hypothetical protein
MWASKMKFDYLHIRVTKETKTAIRQAAKAATKERAGWSLVCPLKSGPP